MKYVTNAFANWMIPSLEKQVADDLLPAIRANSAGSSQGATDLSHFGSNPLLTMWIGGNNFRVPGESGPSDSASEGYQTAKHYIIDNVPGALQQIHDTFAQQASSSPWSAPGIITYYAPTTPDVSLTPKFSTMDIGSKIEISQVIGETNRELKNRLYHLNDAFKNTLVPGRIVVVDTAAMMEEMIDNPQAFGLTNATESCVSSSTGEYKGNCNKENANSYLYWDEFHPTTYVHQKLAKFATNTDLLEQGKDVAMGMPYVANIEWRDQNFPGEISGTGRIIKRGEAMLTLGGVNTFTGGVRFDQGAIRIYHAEGLGDPAGDLVFRGGTLRGSGSFALKNNVHLSQPTINSGTTVSGTFDIDPGYTVVLNGPVLYGDGDLAKAGEGTLDIRSHIDEARDNTYIMSGLLLINSPNVYESRTIVIDPGASLGGAGKVKGSIVNSGSIRAGNTGGELSIDGDYQQSSKGIVVVELINNHEASIHVHGVVDVKGAVLAKVSREMKFQRARRNLIRSDNAMTGAFEAASTTSPFVSINLVQDATSVSAELNRDFQLPGVTANELAMGSYLNGVYSEAPQGDLDRVFAALDVSGQDQPARQALHVLSGAGVAKTDNALAAQQGAAIHSVLNMASASRRRGHGPADRQGVGVTRVGDTAIWAQMASMPWRGHNGHTGAGRDALMSAGIERDWTIAGGMPLTAGVALSHGQVNATWSDDRSMAEGRYSAIVGICIAAEWSSVS